MDKNKYITVCGPDKGPHMALSCDHELYIERNGEFERFDFNEMYKGYYPTCHFTALEYGGVFWLGAESEGLPYLFTSLMGGVWTKQTIDMNSPIGGDMFPYGRILRILWDNINRQAHLVLNSGQLVTLPDCSKCVRIRMVAESPVIDGRLDGRDAVLTLEGGEEFRVPLDDLMQLRVAWSWAGPRIDEGATVYDLRTEEERRPDDLPFKAVCLEPDDAWDDIKASAKERWAFIICRMGLKADVLTKKAREAGYVNVWSLGGTAEPFHTL